MSDPDPDPETVLCCGGARSTDTHLASVVHCVDEEIIEWLERRERRRRRCGVDEATLQNGV